MYQTFDIPLALGRDARSDVRTLPVAKLRELVNMVHDTPGAIRKRKGYVNLSQTVSEFGAVTSSIASARTLKRYGKEILLADANYLYGYSPTTADWQNRGTYRGWRTTQTPFKDDTVVLTGNAIAADGIEVIAWNNPAGGQVGYYSIKDSSGTRVVLANTGDPTAKQLHNGGDAPILLASGTGIHMVYRHNGAEAVYDYFIDGGNQATYTGSLVGGSINPTGSGTGSTIDTAKSRAFDATIYSNGIVWAAAGLGAGELIVGRFTSAGAFGSQAVVATDLDFTATNSDCPVSVAASADGTKVAVVYYASTGTRLRYVLLDSSLSVTASGAVDDTARDPLQATVCWKASTDSFVVHWEVSGYLIYRAVHGSNGAQTTAPTLTYRHSQLASRSFNADGGIFLHTILRPPLSGGTSIQNSFYLWEDEVGICGKLLNGVAKLPSATGQSTLTRPVAVNSAVTTAYVDQSNVLYTIKYEFTEGYHATEAEGIGLLTGPITYQYGGSRVTEHGFLVYPEGVSGSASNSTGTLDNSASYGYRVYYEKTNALGQREQSTLAAVVTVTTGASDDTITLTIPTLQHTRDDAVVAAVYRTEGNGSVYYRLPSTASVLTSANSISYIDTNGDSSITANEIDPHVADANGVAEVDNVPIPAAHYITQGLGRVWAIDSTDRRKLLFTKLPDEDQSIEHSDDFFVRFPEELIAVGFARDQVVGFSETAIYAASGEGPSNTNVGGFSQPYLITRNVGCTNARSLVETPVGWFFLSKKGIWRFQGDGQVQFVGSDVHDYVTTQTITAAVALEKTNEVRFVCASGVGLVFNYEANAWSTFTTACVGVGAAVADGTFYYASSGGVVSQESETLATDNGSAFTCSFTTTWMRPPGQLNSFSKIRRAWLWGTFVSDTIGVEVGYNDVDSTWSTSVSFADITSSYIKFRIANPKLRSIRYRVTLSNASSTTRVSCNAMSMEVLAKQGGHKVADNQGA